MCVSSISDTPSWPKDDNVVNYLSRSFHDVDFMRQYINLHFCADQNEVGYNGWCLFSTCHACLFPLYNLLKWHAVEVHFFNKYTCVYIIFRNCVFWLGSQFWFPFKKLTKEKQHNFKKFALPYCTAMMSKIQMQTVTFIYLQMSNSSQNYVHTLLRFCLLIIL